MTEAESRIITLIEQKIIKDYENSDDLHMIAKKNLMKIQEENIRTYNKKCKEPIKYKVGELVFINQNQFEPKIKILRIVLSNKSEERQTL